LRNRDPHFLLAAVLLHAAAIVVAWSTAASRAPLTWSDDDARTGAPNQQHGELAFDLVPDEPANKPQHSPQPIARRAPAPAPAPNVGRSAPRGPAPEAPSDDATYPDPEAAAGPTAGTDDSLDQKPPPPLPGLDGKPIWSLPGVLPAPALAGRVSPARPVAPDAPPPAPLPLSPQARAALDYLGSGVPRPQRHEPVQHFPAAGTLASAVTEELRSSTMPAESDTVFELVVDAQGHLASVHVAAANPDHRKAAEGVARAVAQRFAAQTFPLPGAFATGSRIQVAVQSKLAMPDGSKHGVSKPRPTLPGTPSPFAIKEDSLDDRFRPDTPASLPPPKLGIAFSLDFDLANIGAKRRRVLHTRIHAVPLAGAP
jgi:hypothetical protein